MFGFNKKQKDNSALPEWTNELTETKQRFFVFVDKLEAKMEELCVAAIPELKELMNSDEDVASRNYERVRYGVKGQLDVIRKKVDDTRDEKVEGLYQEIKSYVTVLDKHHNLLTDFRSECRERSTSFDKKYDNWINQLDATAEKDLEIEYTEIIKEYEAIKDKFKCKQCGGGIPIEKIYVIDTYLTCPHCQTQNTFHTGTKIGTLQHIARGLAEQRTASIYKAWQDEIQKERDLYFAKHNNRESHMDTEAVKKRKAAENDAYEAQRQAAIKNAPILRQQYIKAMYAEWIKTTPDFEEHLLTRMENELKGR